MLAVVDSQTLILPTNEDSANDITDNEDGKTYVVHPAVVLVVVNGEEDETDRAYNRSDCADSRVDLLPNGCILSEVADMTQVALENKGEIKGNNGDSGHGDEHGLEVLTANI